MGNDIEAGEIQVDRRPQEHFEIEKHAPVALEATGAAEAEASQMVWGKYGKGLVWTGIILIMIAYELDNSTIYVYSNYAPSEFNALSQKATLATACTILYAIVKPPIAKFTDVFGRSWTYLITISFYILGYILMSASKNFETYAVGSVFYTIGQSGTNINNDIVVSDISSTKWRAFAISIQFFPFLVIPWVAGSICDAVLSGIGWRWGIAMFCFIMPLCAGFLISILFIHKRKAQKADLVVRPKISLSDFISAIDGGGLFLLCVGFALFFLPISLASTTPSRWNTPWIIAVMVVGGILLLALVPYERFIAKHPILPVAYFRNRTIVFSAVTIFIDSLCFGATHTYLYSWVVMTHDYPVKKATYFLYTNGVVQVFVGIIAGYVIYRTARYKWILFGATVSRTIAYGVMVRLRGADNSDAEIFVVQALQGIGSGVIQTVCVTAAQFQVPHIQTAQVTAIILLSSFLGSGVGSSIAGGIYTNYFESTLQKYMGHNISPETISAIYNSITSSLLPEWGTPERYAANLAYSDIMKWIALAAVCCAGFTVIITFLMPNPQLRDDQNLTEGAPASEERRE